MHLGMSIGIRTKEFYGGILFLSQTGRLPTRTGIWANVAKIPQLSYYHSQILDKAIESLMRKIRHEPTDFNLLSKKFTLPPIAETDRAA
jgi:hypothetical protein